MKKSIGIITIFKANNYGAELQAYATQRTLRDLGYQAELIDYLFYKNPAHRPSRESRPWVRQNLKERLKDWVLYRLAGPLYECIGSLCSTKMRERLASFKRFHQQHSHLSTTYHSLHDLQAATLPYDVYIAGSDQIWNPNMGTSLSPYFLDFAPDTARRISYASSFGVSEIPASCTDTYRRGLARLDRIACREAQGVKLVRQLTGREAVQVLDPTLLLNASQWRAIGKDQLCPPKGKYILIYNIVELEPIYRLALRISKETGWPVVKLCKRGMMLEERPGVQNLPEAGPQEFVSLIDQAALLLTNSFHGCAFALNLNTPMWVVVDAARSNNSRMESLLALAGQTDRLLDSHCDVDRLAYNRPMDFTYTNQALEAERAKSLQYLTEAIEGDTC